MVSRDTRRTGRTNNAVEGWHRGFATNLGAYHPNFWRYLDILKREQCLSKGKLTQLISGQGPPAPRRHKCIILGKILGFCPPGILYPGILSSMGFCPCGVLSPWAFVTLGFCLTWILSPWAFVPLGFCPPGFLSSWDFVRLDIVLWVFVHWDFVLEPVPRHQRHQWYSIKNIGSGMKNNGINLNI